MSAYLNVANARPTPFNICLEASLIDILLQLKRITIKGNEECLHDYEKQIYSWRPRKSDRMGLTMGFTCAM
jgi:hypothetical protein